MTTSKKALITFKPVISSPVSELNWVGGGGKLSLSDIFDMSAKLF